MSVCSLAMSLDAGQNPPTRLVRILFLTYYFPPERTPGAFRSAALLDALLGAGGCSQPVFVDVIATQPSRYPSTTERGPVQEGDRSHRIRRVSVPFQVTSYLREVGNFAAFAASVWRLTRGERYDIVFTTTSRQMTGLLGALAASRSGARLYLDIRDLFAQNLPAMLPWPFWPLAWLVRKAEGWSLHRASRISVSSEGFLAYLQKRGYAEKLRYFPSGADELFIGGSEASHSPEADRPIEILYAGNIGAGQELHNIVPGLAARLGNKARFRIIGDGHQLSLLRSAIEKAGLHNVTLAPPLDRARLAVVYARADVLFLHLGSAAPLEGVLPSKIFEYAASGRPILAGVSGHAARFIQTHIENAAVFSPGDTRAALAALSSLRLCYTDRGDFVRRFSRKKSMREMAQDVLALCAFRA